MRRRKRRSRSSTRLNELLSAGPRKARRPTAAFYATSGTEVFVTSPEELVEVPGGGVEEVGRNHPQGRDRKGMSWAGCCSAFSGAAGASPEQRSIARCRRPRGDSSDQHRTQASQAAGLGGITVTASAPIMVNAAAAILALRCRLRVSSGATSKARDGAKASMRASATAACAAGPTMCGNQAPVTEIVEPLNFNRPGTRRTAATTHWRQRGWHP